MKIETRIAIEEKIVKKTIEVLLAAGYTITVDDGVEKVLQKSKDADDIFNAMMSTDEDQLHVYSKYTKLRVGWIFFVYGNDGYDVICDHTTNLSEVLEPVDQLASELEQEHSTH